ncbi:TadE/TadG family type IV pilus assembly protein [Nocardioides iriomotensis]|uniref:TadE/TadG family type IV pilus assembly protein n=1 Tax=Nocardioides iriomotensis TaxID=715784 RepID=UPI00197E9B3D|nr:TadE/TadG family type IV pilus assembly protein [Nocardioides iriomotensis]
MAVLRRRDDGGATAVEFALVMLPLIYLVFGIIQYGLYFYAMQSGTSAASGAVRELTVGDCQDNSTLRAYIHKRLGPASTTSAAGLTFFKEDGSTTATGPVYYNSSNSEVSAPGNVGGRVALTVKFQAINLHFPFIPVPNDGEVVRTSFGRIENTVPTGGGCT